MTNRTVTTLLLMAAIASIASGIYCIFERNWSGVGLGIAGGFALTMKALDRYEDNRK